MHIVSCRSRLYFACPVDSVLPFVGLAGFFKFDLFLCFAIAQERIVFLTLCRHFKVLNFLHYCLSENVLPL